MDDLQLGLRRDEILFFHMKDFHRQRVSAVAKGEAPMRKRDGGILVLHLIPESCVFSRRLLSGTVLKEKGSRISPLGERGGSTRFNVDGFVNQSSHDEVRAYSQLFRDGRLEAVMSDIGYPVDHHRENSPYAIRCGLTERAVFAVVHNYLRFCQAVELGLPVWLFSTLVGCNGFRMMANRRFRDLSEKAVDRTPAFLPELEISTFNAEPQQLLRPWCDTFWQASGLEVSLNYDDDGNWHQPEG